MSRRRIATIKFREPVSFQTRSPIPSRTTQGPSALPKRLGADRGSHALNSADSPRCTREVIQLMGLPPLSGHLPAPTARAVRVDATRSLTFSTARCRQFSSQSLSGSDLR
jgi:hypothetical protein